ncbi:MAG TPA: hypothetical protein VJK47_03395 [Dehalococcoidales bacterium]|nr:hypothetical protein [Dehalococcoidales bacterium]
MAEKYAIDEMAKSIRTIRKSAEKLKDISGGIQAVDRNADRILSSVKMLELNISDVSGIIIDKKRTIKRR